MDKLLLVLFFAALVSVCAAQVVQPTCIAPREWHSDLFEVRPVAINSVCFACIQIYVSLYKTAYRGARRARLFYDGIQNRTRIEEVVFEDDTRMFYDELFLHNPVSHSQFV